MIQVCDCPKVISNDSMEFDDPIFQKYLMIPHCSKIQRQFQMEVWTLILRKSMVISPSSMVFPYISCLCYQRDFGRPCCVYILIQWFPQNSTICMWALPRIPRTYHIVDLSGPSTYAAYVTPWLSPPPPVVWASAAGQRSVPILHQQQAPPSKEVELSTMGLKLRMGLALSGLALSSMFGVNMLSGIKVGPAKTFGVKSIT